MFKHFIYGFNLQMKFLQRLRFSLFLIFNFYYFRYLVGYLLWGYFLIYLFLFIIGAVILLIRIFIGDKFFTDVLLKMVKVIVTIVIKKIVNIIATRFVFLDRKTNILALDNFRAFNIFLYFNFYFDCFLGVISAVIRLIKALVLSLLMMPSKFLFIY